MDLSTLMPQQRDIVTTLDRPLFVSAGAGSGKTFTLTRRILWALSPESGPYIDSLDQVLAITFTKDAAAEIRERVRGALIEAGMDREALKVDDAWISTIHGMCSRILRAHALELGIDPEFTVLEDTEELMDAAVDHVLARMRAGVDEKGRPQRGYTALNAWYAPTGEADPTGRESGTSVKQLVRRLLELASAAPHGLDDIHLVRGRVDLSSLADAYRPCLEASKKAADVARTALEAIERFEESDRTRDDLAACMLACEMPRASKAFPTEQVALLKAEAGDAFVNAYVACGSDALDELMDLSRRVLAEYEELKAARSALDNNDLLRCTYEAFRDHEALREAYADRFKLVMIDEFQDTDQQQVDLIGYLTGTNGERLCTVGDAQQSIYRFRGAEVEVFRRQQRTLAEQNVAKRSVSEPPAAGDAADAQATDGAGSPTAGGRIVKLVKNFRSHAEVLDYVARIFDDADGGIMPGFLNLEAHDGRKDALVAKGASRRQAILVAGGLSEERTQAKAAAIARRFRALADAGQPVGGMVLLLGGMTRSDVYAQAFREVGLDCVIAGGSVFACAPEVRAVRTLAHALANPADTALGTVPLLSSPMFALGAQEFLALATAYDVQTGETRRRNVDTGLFADDDAPGLQDWPLVARARAVMRRAWSRVGRDSFAEIARDVVNESGWLVRLAARGPEGRAVAANVLKALDALEEAEAQVGRSPRRIVLAFERFLAGKQAPGALNEEGGDAVRIMTVHASKGLEFPVVAVSECFAIRPNSDRMQTHRNGDGSIDVVALPARFRNAYEDGHLVAEGSMIEKRFKKCVTDWLAPELVDDVCASDSVAGSWLTMCNEENRLSLEERARLLYVAMTRAREVCLLAMDAGTSTGKGAPLNLKPERDLTGDVLQRILPDGAARLDGDRLDFDTAQAGDYELIALRDFSYGSDAYQANAEVADGKLVSLTGDGLPDGAGNADGTAAMPADGCAAGTCFVEQGDPYVLDTFTLVWPAENRYRVVPAARPARRSYSYTSVAAALHVEGEDRAGAASAVPEVPVALSEASDDVALETVDAGADAPVSALAAAPERSEDPTALGSAFHAAAQWMVEMGEDDVPTARRDALCKTWGCTSGQRQRLDAALARWCASDVRAEALAWPCVRAEVPFFSLGSEELTGRFGPFAEGAIDLLCTDPVKPDCALVVDYKTGGFADEPVGQLQEKHALQARIYADVLHKAGYACVSLRFVRVEHDDPDRPGQPQVVGYEL